MSHLRKRWHIAGLAALLIVLVSGGALAWHLRLHRTTYLTDADTIKRPLEAALPRDVLWRPAERLAGAFNTATDESEPSVAADAGTFFFARGEAGRGTDIFFCTREAGGWGTPRPLAAVNTEADELGPELSADGRSLYFSSNRAGGLGEYDLWVVYRGPDGWETPVNLGPEVNSRYNDIGPGLTPDGSLLYFASNRPKADQTDAPGPEAWASAVREDLDRRDYDLFTAPIIDARAGPAAPLTELNTTANETAPAVSPAGDFVYFSSDRPGGQGGYDLYRSRRVDLGHTRPGNLGAPLNTRANELDPGVSNGGFALHFCSDRPIGEPGKPRPDGYDLYYSVSREVFRHTETYRASIDWSSLWAVLWPALLTLLLAVLLVALLVAMMRRVEYRRLSLLAKCMLASLLTHALLLVTMAFWTVSLSLSEWTRPGEGVRVTLVSSAIGGDLARQLRGDLASLDVLPPLPPALRQQPLTADPPPAADAALAPMPRALETPHEPNPVDSVRGAPARPPDPPSPRGEVDLEPTANMAVELPAQPRRTTRGEAISALPPSPSAAPERIEPQTDSGATKPRTRVAVDPARSAPEPRSESLVLEQPVRAAHPQPRPVRRSSVSVAALDAPKTADLTMPPVPEPQTRVAQAPTAVRPVAPIAPRHEPVSAIWAPVGEEPVVPMMPSPTASRVTESPIGDARVEEAPVPAPPAVLEAHDLPAFEPTRRVDAILPVPAPAPSGGEPQRAQIRRAAEAMADPASPAEVMVAAGVEPSPNVVLDPAPGVSARDRPATSFATVRAIDASADDGPDPDLAGDPDRGLTGVVLDLPGLREVTTEPADEARTQIALRTGDLARRLGVPVEAGSSEPAAVQMPLGLVTTPADETTLVPPTASEAAEPTVPDIEPGGSSLVVAAASPQVALPPSADARQANRPAPPDAEITAAPGPSAPRAGIGSTLQLEPPVARVVAMPANQRPTENAGESLARGSALDHRPLPGSGTGQAPAPAALFLPDLVLRGLPRLEEQTAAAGAEVAGAAPLAAKLTTARVAWPALGHERHRAGEPASLKPPLMPEARAEAADSRVADLVRGAPDARRLPVELDLGEDAGGRVVSPLAMALDLRLPPPIAIPLNPFVQRAPERREKIIEQMGGTQETEQAVSLARAWFARHQSADGRWNGTRFDYDCGACWGTQNVKSDVALTGLVLLCFITADHTHFKDGPYKDVVERGLTWLVKRQRNNGDLRGNESLYSHGIACIALAEAYGMTGDPRLAGPVKAAVDFIYAARGRRMGGWRYRPGQFGDTSVLGWQMMALTSAKRAGIDVPDHAFEVGRLWMDLVARTSKPGLYAYQPFQDPTPAMTAEGMFVWQLLGAEPTEARMQISADYLVEHPPDWQKNANTYYWYYATLALFQHHGEAWSRWNEVIKRELLAHQETSGRAAGSWDPHGRWAQVGGRVYQTAMCTLTLEVYYRYLPLYLRPPDDR